MIVTALKAGAELFGAAGLVTKLAVILTAGVTLLSAYGIWHHKIWSNGYAAGHEAAINEIAAKDAATIARAQKQRGAFDDCRARGLRWSTVTGQCDRR